MTTHQSLLHQCQDPRWAAGCIEGLEGEVKKLEAQINRVETLPDELLEDYNNANENGYYDSADGVARSRDKLLAALHPQEPTP